ncbi:MAG: hypothetical protein ACKVJK_02165 [Methylophagaceae bacterium]|jgi:hypothetical protein
MKNATPAEVKNWHRTDYWMKGDFDPLVLFVVIPTLIQVIVLGFMLSSMYIIDYTFSK